MSRARILIIDDEDVLCETMRLCLESEGYEVKTANTVEAGLQRLQAQEFDVIILDVLIPGADGPRFIGRLRQQRVAAEILVATSASSHEIAEEAVRQGAFDLLRKPILNLRDKLLRSVDNAVERHTLKADLAAANARRRLLERRLNELCQFSRAILRAEGVEELLGTLEAAVGTLYRPSPHALFRAEADVFVQIGVRDGLRLPLFEDTSQVFYAGDPALPFPPAAGVFPLRCGARLRAAFAIVGLGEKDSEESGPLLALLPVLACQIVALQTPETVRTSASAPAAGGR